MQDDEMMTEYLRSRFVNGDRYLAARAAALARARLGALGVAGGVPDSWSNKNRTQNLVMGMDLSGTDAVVSKQRRMMMMNGIGSGGAVTGLGDGWYADDDGFGTFEGEYVAAAEQLGDDDGEQYDCFSHLLSSNFTVFHSIVQLPTKLFCFDIRLTKSF